MVHKDRNVLWTWSLTCKHNSKAHMLVEARLVSSCFSFPSSAIPRLSLLLANRGSSVYTFSILPPGPKVSLNQDRLYQNLLHLYSLTHLHHIFYWFWHIPRILYGHLLHVAVVGVKNNVGNLIHCKSHNRRQDQVILWSTTFSRLFL